MSVEQTKDPAPVLQTPRRSFVRALGAAAVAILVAPRLARGERPTDKMTLLGSEQVRVLEDMELKGLFSPPPIPRGYLFGSAKSFFPFGFTDINDRQAVFSFHTLAHRSYRRPIRAIIAHEPAGVFWRSRNRQAETFQLVGASNRSHAATYFDGFWEVKFRRVAPTVDPDGWNKSDYHSLVVRTGRVAVAITGYRSEGIAKIDLIEIARAML